jgi:hypothetical protein
MGIKCALWELGAGGGFFGERVWLGSGWVSERGCRDPDVSW